ncbi:hypothetical protein OR571_17470 [Psychrobacillus sp. NEAU-3TGS]|uniref:hypothetical protein n=1 Tax=Psychrobacillus sp. NEAU-3TGS TaxID=2995412 RepID=UPI0024972B14|nr:hypothetical protein [Psychrobacillus sp. NEAU-3TGS]MDI2588841.1 hypothetical protein [Psychrobacillus sp. NEAU-3TGS]
MRILTVTVILRILLIISFAVLAFVNLKNNQLSDMFLNKEISFDYYRENRINAGFYGLIAIIIGMINSSYTQHLSKKRNNGRIKMREVVIPEMTHEDERESEITGKSAKAAFSVIVVFTIPLLISFSMIPYAIHSPLNYAIFAIAILPIVGFITYLITYKVLYSK